MRRKERIDRKRERESSRKGGKRRNRKRSETSSANRRCIRHSVMICRNISAKKLFKIRNFPPPYPKSSPTSHTQKYTLFYGPSKKLCALSLSFYFRTISFPFSFLSFSLAHSLSLSRSPPLSDQKTPTRGTTATSSAHVIISLRRVTPQPLSCEENYFIKIISFITCYKKFLSFLSFLQRKRGMKPYYFFFMKTRLNLEICRLN